jgi:nicotinamidase-related amidase
MQQSQEETQMMKHDFPEKAQIGVDGADKLYRETRINNASVSRRAFVRSGFIATLATVMSPLAHSATWKETQSKQQISQTALLILDFQVGIGDQPYAKSAAQRAAAALKAGRSASLPVVFSKVKFREGYRDIADSNKAFELIKTRNLIPPDASKLISVLQPRHDEIVVDKDRFCAFSGNDLNEVLRSGGIKQLVMVGVATSGVILSTFTLAADEDYSMTILSDACADPKESLHQELMTNLFPRSATVLTVDQWIASLPANG